MKLEIKGHVGVGDLIVQCGIFDALLERYQPKAVCIPCSQEGLLTARHLLFPIAEKRGVKKVHIRTVPSLADVDRIHRSNYWQDSKVVKIGVSAPAFEYRRWDASFYFQAGLNLSDRFTRFSLPGDVWDPKSNPIWSYLLRRGKQKLILFHEVGARSKRLPAAVWERFRNKSGDWLLSIVSHGSLLWWAPIMREADELHLVDSAPANLANSIKLKGCLNIYAMNTPPPSNLNPENQTLVHYVGNWRKP